jgi:NDP-sugar pyrophosphorylase family protein
MTRGEGHEEDSTAVCDDTDGDTEGEMRAMILAAGLGTRLRPLTEYRAKPALPIRGRPVISLLLDFLARHGIGEVMINLHHLPETVRAAVEEDSPAQIRISWSEESKPLGTGGGIRRAASFLAASDECVVLAGDMLLDLDLGDLVARHRRSGRDATLVLRDDPRAIDFGTIGIDTAGRVTRIGNAWGSEVNARCGIFTGVRIFSKQIFDDWPEQDAFEDLRGWLVPGIEVGRIGVGAEFVAPQDSVWEPVGTPSEYLGVNLAPPSLPSLGGDAENWCGDIRILGAAGDVIVGSKSEVGAQAQLERVVVWQGEIVPPRFVAHDGVFAAGRFHDCGPARASARQVH